MRRFLQLLVSTGLIIEALGFSLLPFELQKPLVRPLERQKRCGQPLFAFDPSISIRNGQFNELGQVADIILKSFYVNATSPWKQLYRVGELNRLQQGYSHHNDEPHRMLVAEMNQRIVGFCDIDGRQPNRPTSYRYNPRPYLSDLCIHPDYRRRGVASALIGEAERYCREELAQTMVYIRVEQHNTPAVEMYQRLGYNIIDNPDDPKGKILLLSKPLVAVKIEQQAMTA